MVLPSRVPSVSREKRPALPYSGDFYRAIGDTDFMGVVSLCVIYGRVLCRAESRWHVLSAVLRSPTPFSDYPKFMRICQIEDRVHHVTGRGAVCAFSSSSPRSLRPHLSIVFDQIRNNCPK